MTDAERGYVGAMIDGEGTVHCYPIQGRRGDGLGCYIQVTNTELELLSAMLRATGVGRIYLQTRAGFIGKNGINHTKDTWVWKSLRRNDMKAIADQCWPYSLKLQEASHLF